MSEYAAGQRVEGLFDEEWYAGVISACNGDGTYVIEFDDGDVVHDIAPGELRLPAPADSMAEEGAAVESAKEGGAEYGAIEARESVTDDGFKYAEYEERRLRNPYIEEDDFRYSVRSEGGDPSDSTPAEPLKERALSGMSEFSQTASSEEPSADPALVERVQAMLLPPAWDRYSAQSRSDPAAPLPARRLEHFMFQVTLAEHLRSLQCLYMDAEDELMLCKHIRVKVPGFHARLPTRALMQMVTGGRSRVLALARLNYGASSQQYVRAALELANSYALQGLWAQVAEYTQLARNAFVLARREQSSRLTRRRQLLHARLVLMVFGLVRDACTVNNGQVPEGVATDLAGLLGAEARRLSAQEGAEAEAEEANAGARQLASEVRSFQLRHKYGSWSGQPLEDEARLEERASTPVYGELVSFLRLESPSLRCWLESVHLLLAPQSLAALELVLAHADGGGATLSPARLVLALSEVSAAARVVAGTGLLAWLGKLNTEARVLVDVAQGRLSDVAQGRSEYEEGYVRVVVQIPLAFEELLAMYACDNLDDSAELLEARLQTTQGMAHVFGKETALAEEAFVRALRMLEAAGVEMEICACELYNSVAQLMISRHRQWQEGRKNKSRQEALSWLSLF